MIDKSELIFAVNENNEPIEPVVRKVAHKLGIWHRTTDIVVMNSQNQVLVNKRSILKDTGPGQWDGSFGGHILAGVEPVIGAMQELKEEAGLDAKPSDLELVTVAKFSDRHDWNKEFRYCYIYRWDGNPENLNLEKEEIDEAKWVSLETLKENRENSGEWSPMPYLDELLQKIGKQ